MSKLIRQIVSTDNAEIPIPINEAIVANQKVYVSGCVGFDKNTMKLIEGGVVPETVKALKNLKAVLEAAGSDIEKVIKTTEFVQDLRDFSKVNEKYKKVCKWQSFR